VVRTKKTQLSRGEQTVIAYACAGASLLVMIVSMTAGGWWWLLALPMWGTAAYSTVRGSELVQGRADE
jgi:hypothetical protein